MNFTRIPFLVFVFCFIHGTIFGQTPSNIEAAEYDPGANRWLISNGNTILETHDGGASYAYFANASATHGMEVIDGMLCTIHNNNVRVYDLNDGTQLGSLMIAGAGFLNGMGSRSGELIISDFSAGKIHRVDISDPSNMSSELLISNSGTTPNGVVIDEPNNRAVIVNWGNNAPIIAVDLGTGLLSTVVAATGLGNLDGIDIDGSGNFYVSSWSPAQITKYTNDFSESEVVAQGALDGLSNPADISYAVATDSLGVANSGNDVPSFHYFGATSDVRDSSQPLDQVEWDGTTLTFNCPIAGQWIARAYQSNGQLLAAQDVTLPGAPTRVRPEQWGWSTSTQVLWHFVSPTGIQQTIKPGQRLQ